MFVDERRHASCFEVSCRVSLELMMTLLPTSPTGDKFHACRPTECGNFVDRGSSFCVCQERRDHHVKADLLHVRKVLILYGERSLSKQ